VVSLIDPTVIRLQSGVDNQLEQIIRTYLSPRERAELSRQYGGLRVDFAGREGGSLHRFGVVSPPAGAESLTTR